MWNDEVPRPEPLEWLRDIEKFEHTISLSPACQFNEHNTIGFFLDRQFVTKSGENIADNPEVQAIATVWVSANRFYTLLNNISDQAERTCNVIAALEGVARHDVVLDEKTWQIVGNMQRSSREQQALSTAIRDLKHQLTLSSQTAASASGVFRGERKGKVEERLERYVAEQRAMLDAFIEIQQHVGMPQTPYEVRQYVLSELIVDVDLAIQEIAPMRRAIQHAPLDAELKRRIIDNEATFYRARAQLKKWRDNPSQKFRGKMKDMALLLHETSLDTARMKDQSFHAASKLGMRFFNRGGEVKNPYL